MHYWTKLLWSMALEIEFHFAGSFAVGEAQASSHAEDVGIDCDYRFAPADGCYHIGRLAAHPRERHQFVYVGRHLSSEVFHQFLGHRYEMAGLAVGVGDRTDEGEDFIE